MNLSLQKCKYNLHIQWEFYVWKHKKKILIVINIFQCWSSQILLTHFFFIPYLSQSFSSTWVTSLSIRMAFVFVLAGFVVSHLTQVCVGHSESTCWVSAVAQNCMRETVPAARPCANCNSGTFSASHSE